MFGLGFWEIVVILLVAVVFIRPQDLPKVARKMGRYYGKFRELSRTISMKMRDIGDEFTGLHGDNPKRRDEGEDYNNDHSNGAKKS